MKKVAAITSALLLLIAVTMSAAGYNYIGQIQFKQWLETGGRIRHVCHESTTPRP